MSLQSFPTSRDEPFKNIANVCGLSTSIASFHRKSLTISVPATNSIADSTQHLAFSSSAVQIPEFRAARTRPTAQSQWLMVAFHQRSLKAFKPFRTLTVPECCPAGPTLGLFWWLFYWMRSQQTRFNLLIRPNLLRLDTATTFFHFPSLPFFPSPPTTIHASVTS